MERLWYAVMADKDDTDWGYGSFDKKDAVRMSRELNDGYESNGLDRDSYVAVVSVQLDESGNPIDSYSMCVDTIDVE